MAGLKQIKSKIRSIDKTQTVTKAMEAVSAAKMRKAQLTALSGRAYARAAVSILARVSSSQALRNHVLTRGSEVIFSSTAGLRGDAAENTISSPRKMLYIVITSDKGLAGALNSAVLRKVHAEIRDSNLNASDVSVVAIGRKAQDFFTVRGYSVVAYHPNTENLTSQEIVEIVEESAQRFTSRDVDMVKIAYQHFVSTFEQRPTTRVVFPLSLSELREVVNDIVPARGVFSDLAQEQGSPVPYTVEPSEEEVYNAILPRLASIFVYHALLESQASEHSARMVAMKSASDKADELGHALTLQFNKARQASITREVSEITGGMEAMAS